MNRTDRKALRRERLRERHARSRAHDRCCTRLFFGMLYAVYAVQIIFAAIFMLEEGFDVVIHFSKGGDVPARYIVLVNAVLFAFTALVHCATTAAPSVGRRLGQACGQNRTGIPPATGDRRRATGNRQAATRAQRPATPSHDDRFPCSQNQST